MKIGIISDTHDNFSNLEMALDLLQAEGVRTLLHCGDLCGPGIIQTLSGLEVWIARGNMDRQSELPEVAAQTLGFGRMKRFHRLTLAGYSMAMLHGDDEERLRRTIASNKYAYVFHGHTHRRRDQRIGKTHVINPGALGGMRWQTRSFCILDLTTGEPRFIKV